MRCLSMAKLSKTSLSFYYYKSIDRKFRYEYWRQSENVEGKRRRFYH